MKPIAYARGPYEKPETSKERKFKVITGLSELALLTKAKCRVGVLAVSVQAITAVMLRSTLKIATFVYID